MNPMENARVMHQSMHPVEIGIVQYQQQRYRKHEIDPAILARFRVEPHRAPVNQRNRHQGDCRVDHYCFHGVRNLTPDVVGSCPSSLDTVAVGKAPEYPEKHN